MVEARGMTHVFDVKGARDQLLKFKDIWAVE
jgi:hypothetical protein